MSVTSHDIAIVIISFRPNEVLLTALTAVQEQAAERAQIILLVTGGSLCDHWAETISSHIPASYTLITQTPLRIGQAREFALSQLDYKWISFLDGDCIPHTGWFEALSNAIQCNPNAALIFGPRDPDQGQGIGAAIRRLDGLESRKHLHCGNASVSVDPYRNPLLCAGGNMAVSLPSIYNIGIFDHGYDGVSFEDVDLQIRCHKHDLNVYFCPLMRVSHIHSLGFIGIIRKTLASAKGLSLCRDRHGHVVARLCRWANPGRMIIKIAISQGWLPFGIAAICSTSSPWAYLTITLWLIASWRLASRRPLSAKMTAAWIIRGFRDVIFASIYTILRFIARPEKHPHFTKWRSATR